MDRHSGDIDRSPKRESRIELPDELSQVNLNAAGIDVGASSHFVAVAGGRSEESVREFEAYTAELYRMADWLLECGVETVAMESTGVYWIPLFGVLEERGLEVLLVDPRRLKSVPGRKTDVLDCQWLQQLHTYGLLSGAFRPEAEIRRLRSYLRQRAMLVEYASHHIQHMQKALTQMNIKLQNVISNITGKTGMKIIEAIVEGERSPTKLAQFRHPTMKADEKKIAKSLRGHWREEHIFELTQALELYRAYRRKIEECDQEIESQLGRFDDRSEGSMPAGKRGAKPRQGNAPQFDARTYLYRMTGVDLTAIDGVEAYTALKVVSEVGLDMSRWPRAKHFASWLGLSPKQQGEWRQGDEFADETECEQSGYGTAPGGQRAAPLGQCAGGVPAQEEGSAGRSEGDNGYGPQAGSDHILDAQVRTEVCGRGSGVLRGAAPSESVKQRKEESCASGLQAGACNRHSERAAEHGAITRPIIRMRR